MLYTAHLFPSYFDKKEVFPLQKAIISATNLKKSFGTFEAVKGVSFTVPEGQCVGLLGPNGAGKTTTMRMLMGLCTKTEGQLEVFEKPQHELVRADKIRIGLVPQEDNLDPDLSVRQNLEVYGRYFGLSGKVIGQRVPQLLDFMKITDKAENKVSHLSGGMKRRLVIARSLIADPDFVILDEPTTGLDPQARVMIWKQLISLKEAGKTLLLTTHYMDEAQRLCDHIVIMDSGQVLDEGSPKELISRHVSSYVYEMHKPLPKAFKPNGLDFEDIGDSYLFYVNDIEDMKNRIPEGEAYTRRESNLEDVFLRLTGHALRD